jgi:molybdopterin-guanine dinucleotide biosynthesis protein
MSDDALESTPRLTAGSVARIADFDHRPPQAEPIPRELWATGDYVIGEVLDSGELPCRVETGSGRIARIAPGDLVLGALGVRAATLEAVGDWRAISPDGRMQQLTAACVFGGCTSISGWTHPLADVRYRGHAVRDGDRLTMGGFAEIGKPRAEALSAPVVLIIGTSMSAGKTIVGMTIVRRLKRMGLRVAGAKVTGVARLSDILAFRDAGADFVADFVDAGLPSTVVEPQQYEVALERLLGKIAAARPDVVVVEAGASPLEPYNGDIAVERLGERVRCTVLCASDPYAVAGVMNAFQTKPDVVSGRAASTQAGIVLVRKLVGIPALNPLDEPSLGRLDELLAEKLALAEARDAQA